MTEVIEYKKRKAERWSEVHYWEERNKIVVKIHKKKMVNLLVMTKN